MMLLTLQAVRKCNNEGLELWSQPVYCHVLALFLTSFVTLGNLLNSVVSFLQIEATLAISSQGSWKS